MQEIIHNIDEIIEFALIFGLILFLFYRLIRGNRRKNGEHRDTSITTLVLIDLFGCFIAGPGAALGTGMGVAQSPSLAGEIIFYTCIAGIPLAFICLIVALYFILVKNVDVARKVLKLPIIYAMAWISVAFFGSLIVSIFL